MPNLYSSKKEELTRIDKNVEEVTENISNILQLIDSAIFMATSSSNLVSNLSIVLHKFDGCVTKLCKHQLKKTL